MFVNRRGQAIQYVGFVLALLFVGTSNGQTTNFFELNKTISRIGAQSTFFYVVSMNLSRKIVSLEQSS